MIADTHWGCRNDNPNFYDYQQKFISNVFIPYLKKFKIKHVVHLGDLVDNRKQINVQTGSRLREDFLEPLNALEIDVMFIAGNHDVYYKTSNRINALREIVDGKYNIKLYDNLPTEVMIDGTKILMVPWISPENREASLRWIEASNTKYCMAHLELKGFEQTKGRLASHGDNYELFQKFDAVFSGHYHIRSNRNNIYYIGSAFHFNWGDYSNFAGFMVLDTDTGERVWIKNPYKIFTKFEYDEDSIPDVAEAKDTYCRVNVVNKTSESKFNDFIDKINELGVIDLLIDEKVAPVEIGQEETEEEISDDTLELFRKAISKLDVSDREELQLLTEEIYKEALEVN